MRLVGHLKYVTNSISSRRKKLLNFQNNLKFYAEITTNILTNFGKNSTNRNTDINRMNRNRLIHMINKTI